MPVPDLSDAAPGDVTAGPVTCPRESTNKPAGFWIRFAATLVDAAILYAGVRAASRLAVMTGVYLPFEMTMILSCVCYSVLLLRWKGRTLGKALCGVTVRSRNQEPIGLRRALARETLGKLVSTAGLLIGFIWVAISPRKKAWHDWLTGTIAVQDSRVAHRAHITLATVLAGVRCVAMEVCLAQDNAAIERLVTASDFDGDLAMTIARHQPFKLWGWKGYWDVFETAWRLNQNIPVGEEKFRVIGLDRQMDMPSVAMLGLEDNAARDCPFWEKLRIFRVLRTIPLVLARDAFMPASSRGACVTAPGTGGGSSGGGQDAAYQVIVTGISGEGSETGEQTTLEGIALIGTMLTVD